MQSNYKSFPLRSDLPQDQIYQYLTVKQKAFVTDLTREGAKFVICVKDGRPWIDVKYRVPFHEQEDYDESDYEITDYELCSGEHGD